MPRLAASTAIPLLLFAGLAATLAIGLDHPLLNVNEGLYARVAQEMAHGGSWIVPSLEGVPYLEKPPLVYWVTALAFKAFGLSSWSARSASLLGTALMLESVYLLAARRLGRRAAVYSTLVLASFPLVIATTRTLMFDGLFTGLLTASLVALHEAFASERGARWMRASAALLAAAVLAKGLAAPLFHGAVAAVLVLAAPGAERRRRAAILADPLAIAIFLALAVPWHVAAALREPSFARFYFVNEHVLRFLGMRVPHDYHTGAPWYYLPRIVLYAFPWILLLLVPARQGVERRGPLRGFVAAWILVPLAFFSASSAKGDYYMIVALPPLALLLGARLAALADARAFALVPLGWMGVLAAGAAYLAWMPSRFQPPDHAGLVLALGFAICAGSLAALRARRTEVAIAASAAMAVPFALLLSGFIAANGELKSAQRLAAAIDAQHPRAVYLFRDYERFSALPFYLGRPVGVIDSQSSDLWYGLGLRHDRGRFPSMARFARELGADRVVVVVAAPAVADFRASIPGRAFWPVGTYGEAWLFANGVPPRVASAAPRTQGR
jgi:4-amino-4-deoxy-L-arabinose transferase-like glycosyltransferase